METAPQEPILAVPEPAVDTGLPASSGEFGTVLERSRAAETDSVGERLAGARSARGLSVSDVAAQLKYAPRQIVALEQNRWDALPGGAIVRGMVRSYARLLGLDGGELVSRLAVEVPGADPIAERFRQPVPFSASGKRRNLAYLLASLAALATALVTLVPWTDTDLAPARAGGVNAPAAAATADVPSDAVPSAQGPAVEPISLRTGDSAGVSPSAPGNAPASAVAKGNESATAATGDAPNGAGMPGTGGTRRITLKFERDAWVSVQDGSAKTVFSQLNRAGSEKELDIAGPLAFTIGNARFVTLLVDGKPVDLSPWVKVEVARVALP
jgi:cytoskeleton protein RodZ